MSKELIEKIKLSCKHNQSYPIKEIIDSLTMYDQQLAELKAELQTYKGAWNELRNYINTYQDDCIWVNKTVYEAQDDFLEKMQELQKKGDLK